MKTINDYEPNNKLQKAYDKLWGGCLCGHSEWCVYCDGSMQPARESLEEAAAAIDYQLYINIGSNPRPIKNKFNI